MNIDTSRAAWRKSSRSQGNSACVEVATIDDGIAVRDSKNPGGSVLVFAGSAWSAFVEGIRDGEFDLG